LEYQEGDRRISLRWILKSCNGIGSELCVVSGCGISDVAYCKELTYHVEVSYIEGREQTLRYELGDRGSVPRRSRDGIPSLRHRMQSCSGTHPASYAVGTTASYPWGKAGGP